MKLNILNKINLINEPYLIIGTSAGPDSMALLDIMKKSFNIPIVCVHINHNVRKQSKKEEKYLENYCNEHNIIFECYKIQNYQENNFENEARKKRYQFYKQVLKKYNCKYLFLAHHADDLIETILMKITRGSNIEGYAGIKEINYYDNYYIVRPLLEYTKKDILQYNKDNKIKYFIDKTNKDINYKRNRYRKYILPILKKEDKKIHKKFLKYSKTLLEYDQYIKEEINNIKKEIYNEYLDLINFKKQKLFIQKNLLFNILNELYNNKDNIIKEKNIEDIINIINNEKPNININLPQNIIVVKEYDKLYFKKKNILKDYCHKLKEYQEINGIIIEKIKETKEDGNNICRLNSKEITSPIYIRNKKDGDNMQVKGLNGHKKIKDIFIDLKIPLQKRNTYPLLVDSNNNILWIPNYKKSQFNKKKNENYDIILKCYERKEKNEK